MRLVDLHCDWLRQYAAELTWYDSAPSAGTAALVRRLEGYLLGTSISVLACDGQSIARAKQADPWHVLSLMLARYEAEFSGRLLCDPADVERFQASPPDGLCWGVLAVAGFDDLVRAEADLDRLPDLFRRGVRVFQPLGGEASALGSSSDQVDGPGLTDLGRAFLDRLPELGTGPPTGPRPILDLAGMGVATMGNVLQRFGQAPDRFARVLLIWSHATGDLRVLLDPASPGHENLRRFRALGGVLGITPGLPGCTSPDELKEVVERLSAIPSPDPSPGAGIAIASDLLGSSESARALRTVRDLTRFVAQTLDRPRSQPIIAGNARALLLRSAGTSP